jgi:hypothetical protein
LSAAGLPVHIHRADAAGDVDFPGQELAEHGVVGLFSLGRSGVGVEFFFFGRAIIDTRILSDVLSKIMAPTDS